MSAPLSRELRTKYTVRACLRPRSHVHSLPYHTLTCYCFQVNAKLTAYMTTVQVGAVSVRKDDEVTVVRGTYKVTPHVVIALCWDFSLHNDCWAAEPHRRMPKVF